MGLGFDIRETLDDVGASFTILRNSGNIAGEFLVSKPNSQVTKPFIREFFLEAMLQDDTDVVAGDVIRLDTTLACYLVMNKTPYTFENEIIKYDVVLYKCNVSGELFRLSGESDFNPQTFRIEPKWDTVKNNCYALQTASLFGNTLDNNEELGKLGIEAHELYLPESIGTKVLDRYQPVSGEYYQVETVLVRRFDGVVVATLNEDTR